MKIATLDCEQGKTMQLAELSGLIERIYDCSIDPALWPSTLEGIAATLDSPAATVNVIDFASGAERTLVHSGISDHYQALYRERYHGCNLFGHGMMLRPIDQPATSDELVDEAELLGSRIYREWAAPQGFRHVMLSGLLKTQARLAFVGVTRTHEQERYGEHDRALLALLSPHIRRAVTIADLIDYRSLESGLFATVLDAVTTAVLITGETGDLFHANAAGEALLSRGDVLVCRRGSVEPACAQDQHPLLFPAALHGRARTVGLPRKGGGNAVVSVLPLTTATRTLPGGKGRLALFIQDNPAGASAVETLGLAFGLTGAELRVLLGLTEGATPAEIAARYGIALSTVKTHLKRLFAKTGTHRQKDLVALLFAAPPIRSDAVAWARM